MMKFLFTKTAEKQWQNLSPEIQGFIKSKVEEYRCKPELFERNLRKVKNLTPADHRLRLGNYRFLLEFNFETNIHRVLKVGHRREIYK